MTSLSLSRRQRCRWSNHQREQRSWPGRRRGVRRRGGESEQSSFWRLNDSTVSVTKVVFAADARKTDKRKRELVGYRDYCRGTNVMMEEGEW